MAAAVDDAGPDLLALGRRIRHLRRERGMTLAELAARVERAPSQLSLIENGRREPRLTVLQAIAAALDVPLTDLLAPDPPQPAGRPGDRAGARAARAGLRRPAPAAGPGQQPYAQ